MRRFAWDIMTAGDGLYLFPVIYVWFGLKSYGSVVFVDIGFTFLRWAFVVTWYRKPLQEAEG